MSLHKTPQGDRTQIAIYGKRNAGKSSLINAITGQPLAIVSDVKGTTTDPVSKAMEILPIGPCMLIDTPGLDDEGELGQKRIQKAMQVLNKTDIALVVLDSSALSKEELDSERGLPLKECEVLAQIEERKIPAILVLNQTDKLTTDAMQQTQRIIMQKNPSLPVIAVSAKNGTGIQELKDAMIQKAPDVDCKLHIIGDKVEAGDIVVLVVPVDSAAPKGRLIMPQQQVIRDLLDHQAVAVVTQVPELSSVLERLKGQVKLVITDSQAFKEVAQIVPKELYLTSFSILFARHKGNLKKLVEGLRYIDRLQDNSRVLIAEGCTHHRQCDDIGTVKIPRWLRQYTGKELVIENSSGHEFPEDLTSYDLVIHCGGCTLHEKEMKHRIALANRQQVPIVNYGIFIAYVNGILERSIEIFPEIHRLIKGEEDESI